MICPFSYIGEGDEKGKVVGIFRSLGALSRAIGPFVACTGEPGHASVILMVGF